MSIVARADGAWRLIDCKEKSGVYVRDAGEWISLCPDEPEVLPPFELITGYTIEHVGTSASLVGGQVEFTGVTSLSLDGVFSADFDNYVVAANYVADDNRTLFYRMRTAGTDDSGTNYTAQRLEAASTTVAGQRYTSENRGRLNNAFSGPSSFNAAFYGPFLAQPTATRTTTIFAANSTTPSIVDYATTHSLSTSYDSFSIVINAGNFTGKLAVYGVRS